MVAVLGMATIIGILTNDNPWDGCNLLVHLGDVDRFEVGDLSWDGDNPKDTSLAAKGALANRRQRRTACKIQNGRQGTQKWRRGSGKVSNPRFLGVLSNFR